MFNEDGSYSPPDIATRHVLIATRAHEGRLGQRGFPVDVPSGYVLAVAMMGQTNVPGVGVPYPHPQASATWIEHETAKPKDIIPEAELSALIEAAQKKQAAVKVFWDAERAKTAKPSQ